MPQRSGRGAVATRHGRTRQGPASHGIEPRDSTSLRSLGLADTVPRLRDYPRGRPQSERATAPRALRMASLLGGYKQAATAMTSTRRPRRVWGGMHEPPDIPMEMERLQGHAERAFVEVQRADTKATALCGIAGGLLAAGVAVLTSAHGMPLIGVFSLVLMCLLLMAAIGAALLALRPVVPRAGLHAELMREAVVHHQVGVSVAMRGELERYVEAHRLQVLAWLADCQRVRASAKAGSSSARRCSAAASSRARSASSGCCSNSASSPSAELSGGRPPTAGSRLTKPRNDCQICCPALPAAPPASAISSSSGIGSTDPLHESTPLPSWAVLHRGGRRPLSSGGSVSPRPSREAGDAPAGPFGPAQPSSETGRPDGSWMRLSASRSSSGSATIVRARSPYALARGPSASLSAARKRHRCSTPSSMGSPCSAASILRASSPARSSSVTRVASPHSARSRSEPSSVHTSIQLSGSHGAGPFRVR